MPVTYLIAASDFTGQYLIPNSEQKGVVDEINDLIAENEPKFLKEALGYAFGKTFKDGYDADEQRFKDLFDGCEFTFGSLQQWPGLKEGLVAYVYAAWMKANAYTTTTTMGEKKAETAHATSASAAAKHSAAWNRMIGVLRSCYLFLDIKKDDYPEFKKDEVTTLYVTNRMGI